jgi:hypothetical protein
MFNLEPDPYVTEADNEGFFPSLREANKEEIQEQEKIIQDGNLYTN